MQQRLSYVDGLRAIAVLAVVVEHVGSYLFRANSVPGQITRSGMHGVDLFFVISGFCLSYPVIARMHECGSALFEAVKYCARRTIRILPPYYLAICILALGYAATGSALTWADILRQFLLLDGGPAGHTLNPSFWTLPIEFRWYAAFPFLLALWVKAPRAFFLLAGLLVLSAATKLASDDVLILPAFMLGIAAAALFVRGTNCTAIALAAAAVFAVIGALRTAANWQYCIHPAWQAAAFCFAAGCGSSRALRSVLSAPPLTWIGTASYSIYLIHYPLLNYLVHRGVNAAIAGVVAIAAGAVFWRIAERPFTADSQIRRTLLDAAERILSRTFAFLQMPRSFVLAGPLHPEPAAAVSVAARSASDAARAVLAESHG